MNPRKQASHCNPESKSADWRLSRWEVNSGSKTASSSRIKTRFQPAAFAVSRARRWASTQPPRPAQVFARSPPRNQGALPDPEISRPSTADTRCSLPAGMTPSVSARNCCQRSGRWSRLMTRTASMPSQNGVFSVLMGEAIKIQ